MTYLVDAANKINSNDLQGALAALVEGLAVGAGLEVEYSNVPERFAIILKKGDELLTDVGNVEEAPVQEEAANTAESEVETSEPEEKTDTPAEIPSDAQPEEQAAPATTEKETTNG